MVTVIIGRKEAVFFGAIILVFVVGSFVIAYGGSNPVLMGHTAGELAVIDEDGITISLEQYVDDRAFGLRDSLNCGTAIYDSMSKTDGEGESGVEYNDLGGRYSSVSVDSSCKNTLCIIKQEIYDSSGVKINRQFSYTQDDAGKWWSSHQTSRTSTNGDTISSDVIPQYSNLGMRDDVSLAPIYTETSLDSWSFIDVTETYGMKVYICMRI